PIGDYTKGCVAGAVQLPADGPNWQVMRPSRNRACGHPILVGFLQRLAATLPSVANWPRLLVGDIGQPRGGPMLTGHTSHQVGLDADIWLTPMPDRRLTPAERDNMSATDLVNSNGSNIDPRIWRPEHRRLLEAIARSPEVERIFVNPAIKPALCREAGAERAWLARVRPRWGQNYHFHARLACPRGEPECHNHAAPPSREGCGPGPHRQDPVARAQPGLACRASFRQPGDDDRIVHFGRIEPEPGPRRPVGPAKRQEILEDRR